MGLVVPWSCTLAMIDVYSILMGCPLRVPGVMVIVVVGDCVCSFASATLCSFSKLSVLPSHVHISNKQFLLKICFQVLSILSFAGACSSAAVIDLLLQFHGSHCSPRFCGRYQLSAMMAFLSWFLTAASALFIFWFLVSRHALMD
jgi:hypothetical protein